jgi:hypothetical protein
MKIKTGTPKKNGVYLIYTDPLLENKKYCYTMQIEWAGYWKYPKQELKYNGCVYGWIGPIPQAAINDLLGLTICRKKKRKLKRLL